MSSVTQSQEQKERDEIEEPEKERRVSGLVYHANIDSSQNYGPNNQEKQEGGKDLEN